VVHEEWRGGHDAGERMMQNGFRMMPILLNLKIMGKIGKSHKSIVSGKKLQRNEMIIE